MLDLTSLNNYHKNNRLEAKKAQNGLPQSIWETYASFANTNGGVILLGVEEHNSTLRSIHLPDPEKLIKDFWDTWRRRLQMQ